MDPSTQGTDAAHFVLQFVTSQRDQEVIQERGQIYAAVRDFVSRNRFPVETFIITFVLGEDNEHRSLLRYDLAKRLWEAGGRDTIMGMYKEIRLVGHMMTSLEEMHFHRAVIDHLLLSEDLIPEERGRHGLPYCPLIGYKGFIDQMWSGIHGWEN
jgi:hypothetical protein